MSSWLGLSYGAQAGPHPATSLMVSSVVSLHFPVLPPWQLTPAGLVSWLVCSEPHVLTEAFVGMACHHLRGVNAAHGVLVFVYLVALKFFALHY